jgi:hypothetical protein
MHIAMHSFNIAIDAPRRLSDRERPSPCHCPQQFPTLCRHDLEEQFRSSKANAGALLSARERSLSTAFDFLERGDFERHSFHFSVSMLQRHSINRLTVSRDQRIYNALL